VLLISDGQPHDVDVHDPRYLVDDALHAVHGARRRGVRMACLSVGAVATPAALRIFGRHGAQRLPDLDSLPQALRRLMA
jgi:nitric oxide reductase activation protein